MSKTTATIKTRSTHAFGIVSLKGEEPALIGYAQNEANAHKRAVKEGPGHVIAPITNGEITFEVDATKVDPQTGKNALGEVPTAPAKKAAAKKAPAKKAEPKGLTEREMKRIVGTELHVWAERLIAGWDEDQPNSVAGDRAGVSAAFAAEAIEAWMKYVPRNAEA
jgi:hypothetical protein